MRSTASTFRCAWPTCPPLTGSDRPSVDLRKSAILHSERVLYGVRTPHGLEPVLRQIRGGRSRGPRLAFVARLCRPKDRSRAHRARPAAWTLPLSNWGDRLRWFGDGRDKSFETGRSEAETGQSEAETERSGGERRHCEVSQRPGAPESVKARRGRTASRERTPSRVFASAEQVFQMGSAHTSGCGSGAHRSPSCSPAMIWLASTTASRILV